ncbi:hypothetical protein [Actinomadura macra]|uniref:hypothetical protein n=1 Tax=Actinomadura macra TaxID=46164 RepID=UPI0009FDC279|nr:hypothetical protein [Actinomadura macra]
MTHASCLIVPSGGRWTGERRVPVRGKVDGRLGVAAQAPIAGDEDSGPNWSQQGFADQSLRQVWLDRPA